MGEERCFGSVWQRLLDTTAVQYRTIMITGSQISKPETNIERKRRGMYRKVRIAQLSVRMLDLCLLL